MNGKDFLTSRQQEAIKNKFAIECDVVMSKNDEVIVFHDTNIKRLTNIDLNILYEDNDILVVNKPAGMVVHPAPGHEKGTLVNALLSHCSDLSGIGGVERPGIVHRLDKDTSGVVLIAKNEIAHRAIAEQFKNHSMRRSLQR